MKKTATILAAAAGVLALAACGNPTESLANPSQAQVDEACIVAAESSNASYSHPEGIEAYTASLSDSEKVDRLKALKILGNADSEEGQYISPDIVEAADSIEDVTDPEQFSTGHANALRSAQIDCSYGYIKYSGNVEDLR